MKNPPSIMFSSWARLVAEFLSYNIPYDAVLGWLHLNQSEFISGCDALIALGQALETEWGARPRRFPEFPNPPPHWDDMCAAVIQVATKTKQLRFQPLDVSSSELGAEDDDRLSMDVIAAAHDLRAAFATVNLCPVLVALGLIEGGHWSLAAEALQKRADVKALE
ncbi:hypothetical protein QTL95_21925 [Rhizobium sp. S152]|uniref:hypothetical protein n=1 Tax=Rhizobium sp. S152 TaxID=3055038 RepID=UPI0025A972E3|nr:hypothetical protein [Rhizobium sp. S152]MDM9628561.1 hypothetical protein [Rhizobium sp. S152]